MPKASLPPSKTLFFKAISGQLFLKKVSWVKHLSFSSLHRLAFLKVQGAYFVKINNFALKLIHYLFLIAPTDHHANFV